MSFVDTAPRFPESVSDAAPAPFMAATGSDVPSTHIGAETTLRGRVAVTLSMRHAGTRQLDIAYELHGAAGAPVVFVAGGISAHRHLASNTACGDAGWAEHLVGTARALDPARVRLLAFDYVGADGALDAPIETADQADAIIALLDVLGIDTLSAFVGYSYGALVGLQLAARHPTRLRKLVAVSGAHRAHPFAAAWRALQRKAVALGELQCADGQGLSLARQFAMLSYRTPEEFAERFDAAPVVINGQVRVAAEDYLDAAGARYVARTSVTAWRRLSESIDLHRVEPSAIRVPTTIVAVEGDRLVPLSEAVTLLEGLGPCGQLRVLRSPYGHDAFLKETDRIDAILATALQHTGNRT